MASIEKRVEYKDVKVNVSASEWELFSMKGDNKVANSLNKAVEKAVLKHGDNIEAVFNDVREVMSKYSDYGASDSEPEDRLAQVLSEIYDKDISRFDY